MKRLGRLLGDHLEHLDRGIQLLGALRLAEHGFNQLRKFQEWHEADDDAHRLVNEPLIAPHT
jgi:hypothetical protein